MFLEIKLIFNFNINLNKKNMKTIAQEFNKKINKASMIEERIYQINKAEKQIKFDVGEKHKQIFVFSDNSKLEIFTKSKKSRVLK